MTSFPDVNFDLNWDSSHPNWYDHLGLLPKHGNFVNWFMDLIIGKKDVKQGLFKTFVR